MSVPLIRADVTYIVVIAGRGKVWPVRSGSRKGRRVFTSGAARLVADGSAMEGLVGVVGMPARNARQRERPQFQWIEQHAARVDRGGTTCWQVGVAIRLEHQRLAHQQLA